VDVELVVKELLGVHRVQEHHLRIGLELGVVDEELDNDHEVDSILELSINFIRHLLSRFLVVLAGLLLLSQGQLQLVQLVLEGRAEALEAHGYETEDERRKQLVHVVHREDFEDDPEKHPDPLLALLALEDFLSSGNVPTGCTLFVQDLQCFLDVVETGLLRAGL